MLQLERSTEVAAGMADTADTLGITQEIREKAKANNPVPTKKAS